MLRLLPSLIVSALLCTTACGKKGPDPHPAGSIGNRNAARIGVVDLIIKDRARAARVKEIYLEVWQLVRDFNLNRNAEYLHLIQSPPGRRLSPQEIRSMLTSIRSLGRDSGERYVALMMEVRELTTEEEFNQLIVISGAYKEPKQKKEKR